MNSALINALMMMSNPAGGPVPQRQQGSPMVDALIGPSNAAMERPRFGIDPFGMPTEGDFDPLRRPGTRPPQPVDPFGMNRTDPNQR